MEKLFRVVKTHQPYLCSDLCSIKIQEEYLEAFYHIEIIPALIPISIRPREASEEKSHVFNFLSVLPQRLKNSQQVFMETNSFVYMGFPMNSYGRRRNGWFSGQLYTFSLWKSGAEVMEDEKGPTRMWVYHKAHDCVLLITSGSWYNKYSSECILSWRIKV